MAEKIDSNVDEPAGGETGQGDDTKLREAAKRFGRIAVSGEAKSGAAESVIEDGAADHGDRHLERERQLDDRLQAAVARESAELHARAVDAEPTVTRDVGEAARSVGSKLDGLEHKLKTESSLQEKLTKFPLSRKQRNEPEKAIAGRGRSVNDALRYTVISTEERYMTARAKLSDRLTAQGYTLARSSNSWVPPDGSVAEPYRGINETWRSPEDYTFEIQFHTSASYAMKDVNHKLYEEWRKPDTPLLRAQEVAGIMSGRFDGVPVPPGALAGRGSTP
ncbi:MAG TPA: hypothetical protein VF635_00070 [Propionibacteriaceae bacterium]|jgi:hypothetical protein